jgi:hypothetical protein
MADEPVDDVRRALAALGTGDGAAGPLDVDALWRSGQQRSRQRRRRRRVGTAVTVAAGLAVAALVIVRVGDDGGSTPAGDRVVTPTVAATPTSAPVTATSAPTDGTTAPTTSPATASTAPAHTVLGAPSGTGLPHGLLPLSLSFPTAADGWLLGATGLSGPWQLFQTDDGGASWRGPQATLDLGATATADGVRVVFATTRDGWVWGRAGLLLATHDGGTTWAPAVLPVALPAGEQDVPVDLATDGTMVVVVGLGTPPGADGPAIVIQSSRVDHEGWTASPTTRPIGAGPVPQPHLAAAGGAVWVVEDDRTFIGGARRSPDGSWTGWRPPCRGTDTVTVAASSADDLVVTCETSGFGDDTYRIAAIRSTDGGLTFGAEHRLPDRTRGISRPAPGVLFGSRPSGESASALVASFDDGATWATVRTDPVDVVDAPPPLFTTAERGWAVRTSFDSAGPRGQLVATTDGGRTWTDVTALEQPDGTGPCGPGVCATVSPAVAAVGEQVSLSGSPELVAAIRAVVPDVLDDPLAVGYFALDRLDGEPGHFCELIAGVVEPHLSASLESGLTGSFTVPAEGGCFQSDERRPLTPGTYSLLYGPHPNVIATLELR